jgi:hypothetical protein
VKGRHALTIGFGLGALTILGLIVLFNRAVFVSPRTTSGNASAATPSPSPSPAASPAHTSPGPRAAAVMVYDPENHGVIMFGGGSSVHMADGTNPGVTFDDTWLWNGKRWQRLDVQGPPARGAAMAAYDSVRHVIVLFGGSGPQGIGQGKYFQDTWTWDGSRWQEQHPAHVPNPRARAAMAFDEKRGVVVMFGGEGETTTYTATWTWDGADWTLMDPATVPPARHFAGMAYDAARGVTVLFGGTMPGVRLDDTWTWDGAGWTRQAAAAPAASGWSSLVYDATLQQVVAYVYFALDNHPVAEYTIAWDGTKWIDRTTPTDPSPRADTMMAYDQGSRLLVLYGGTFDQPQPFGETWVWDGSKWSLWEPAGGA